MTKLIGPERSAVSLDRQQMPMKVLAVRLSTP
jgi:hypothetical protein